MISRRACRRLALCAVASLAVAGAHAADPELGRRIYLQGILPSGEPLAATTMGDVELAGEPVSCAACHRRSGFGTAEGGAYVPPITTPWLFDARSCSASSTRRFSRAGSRHGSVTGASGPLTRPTPSPSPSVKAVTRPAAPSTR